MARARLTAFVGLNTTSFQRGLRAMRRRWRAFRRAVAGPMTRFGARMGQAFRRGAIIMGAALVGAIKHANDFRQQMALVNTMLNGQDLEKYAEGILKMSGRFGMAKTALTKGLYDIFSAGVAAKDGMQFLEVATRAAIGGATDTAVSVDALTSVMNAYGMKAREVSHVSDVLFQIVKDGKITYEELAENIGKLAPTARAAGLSLEQMGAAIATAVKVEDPSRAMTALRQAMFEAAEEGENLFQLAARFKNASLEDIIAAGIGKKTAAGVVLLGNNFETLLEEVEKFKDVSGRAADAFDKMDKVRHWAKLWQTVLALVTRVGVVLDKALAPAINYLTNQLDKLADTPGFKRFIEQVNEAAKTITGVAVALARGGDARRTALKGLSLVIVGAFQSAAVKAANILMKIAPSIGAMIGAAATAVFDNKMNKMENEIVAKHLVTKEFKKEGKSLATRGFGENISRDNTAEFSQRVAEKIEGINQLAVKNAVAKARGTFKIDFGEGTGKEKRDKGFALLEKAAKLATEDLAEFKPEPPPEVTGDEVITKGGIPGGAKQPVAAERDFTELRRIGANIISGAGPRNKEDAAQKTRQKSLKEQEEQTKLLKKVAAGIGVIEDEVGGTGGATF